MKRKEQETAREKRRVFERNQDYSIFISLCVIQEELKIKIDLEEQYANDAKNTLAASIKKTVRRLYNIVSNLY